MSVEIRKPLAFKGDELKRAQTEKAVKHCLQTTCDDRLLLLSIVAGGPSHWRNVAKKAFQGLYCSDKMLDDMFGFLVEQAGPEPKAQLDALLRADLVALKLDKLKGLARFIESERHLDEVLERCVPEDAERDAIRQQMLIILKQKVH